MSSSLCSGKQEQEAEPIRIEEKRNGTGRKKIEMKKIERKSSQQVAFSKRIEGLFKKGCELCQLCDAMIAIIVISSEGRVYSYGHPSVDVFIDQFQREEDEENQYNVGDEGGSISLSHEENCETDCFWEFHRRRRRGRGGGGRRGVLVGGGNRGIRVGGTREEKGLYGGVKRQYGFFTRRNNGS